MISPAPKPATAAQREIGLLGQLHEPEVFACMRWSDLAPPDPDPDAGPEPLCWEDGWDQRAILPLPPVQHHDKPAIETRQPAKPEPERQEVIDSWEIPPPLSPSPPDGSLSAVLPETVTATLGNDGDSGGNLLESLEATIEKRFHHSIQPAHLAPLPSRRPAARIEERLVVAQSAQAALQSKSPPLSSPQASTRARPKLTLEDYRKHRRDGP